MKQDFQLDFTHSNFYELIGFDKKIIKDPINIGPRVPNLSQDTDILNIHCDLINESLVDGKIQTLVLAPVYFNLLILSPSNQNA